MKYHMGDELEHMVPGIVHTHEFVSRHLSNITQQILGWGLLHADVGEELLAGIFQRGPKEIDHTVDDQKTIVITLTHIYNNRWILLVMALHVELLLLG